MSIVGRKGKLSLKPDLGASQDVIWERIEDVLTADVFGAYRYLPLECGLIPFLSHAKNEFGSSLTDFLDQQGVPVDQLSYARILFWPALGDGSEPDLLMLLGTGPDQLEVALMAEAKLHSPQHKIEREGVERSQIGHYLTQHLLGTYGSSVLSMNLPQVRPFLYITRAREAPRQELRQAKQEVMEAIPESDASKVGLFWCSWSMAGREALRLWRKHRREVQEKSWVRLLLDLWQDLDTRGLMPRKPFRGISRPSAGFAWQYETGLPMALPRAAIGSGPYPLRELIRSPMIGGLPAVVHRRNSLQKAPWAVANAAWPKIYEEEEEV